MKRKREKLKIKILLEQIDSEIAQKYAEQEQTASFSPESLADIVKDINELLAKKSVLANKEEKANRKEGQAVARIRIEPGRVSNSLSKFRGGNSYTKTDRNVTFIRLKDDAMNNG